MLSSLFQCCQQPKSARENEINRNVSEANDQRHENADNDSFLLTTSFSFHNMNTPIDYSSDGTSYYSESMTDSISSEENGRKHYVYNPLYIEYPMKHSRNVQRLSRPTITIVHLAIERIMKDPHWEQVEPFKIQYNDFQHQLHFTKILHETATDFSSCQQNIIHEHQPIIYFYQPDDDSLSMTSEIHGFDSATIDIFKPKQSTSTDNIQARVKDFLSLPHNLSQHRIEQPAKEKISRESKNVKFSILSSQLNNHIDY